MMLGVPWELIESQAVIAFQLALFGLTLKQWVFPIRVARQRFEEWLWLGSDALGWETGSAQLLGSVRLQIVRWLDTQGVEPGGLTFLQMSIVAPIVDRTCELSEEILDVFGLDARSSPLIVRSVHGLILLTLFPVLEVGSLAIITGAAYSTYFVTGAAIDLTQWYQITLGFLLLIVFGALAEANDRFEDPPGILSRVN